MVTKFINVTFVVTRLSEKYIQNIHERLQTDFNEAVKAADSDYKDKNKKD